MNLNIILFKIFMNVLRTSRAESDSGNTRPPRSHPSFQNPNHVIVQASLITKAFISTVEELPITSSIFNELSQLICTICNITSTFTGNPHLLTTTTIFIFQVIWHEHLTTCYNSCHKTRCTTTNDYDLFHLTSPQQLWALTSSIVSWREAPRLTPPNVRPA